MSREAQVGNGATCATAKRGMVLSGIFAVLFIALGIGLFVWAASSSHGGSYGNPIMVDGPGGTPLSFFLGVGVLIDVVPTGICLYYAVLHTRCFFTEKRKGDQPQGNGM